MNTPSRRFDNESIPDTGITKPRIHDVKLGVLCRSVSLRGADVYIEFDRASLEPGRRLTSLQFAYIYIDSGWRLFGH